MRFLIFSQGERSTRRLYIAEKAYLKRDWCDDAVSDGICRSSRYWLLI